MGFLEFIQSLADSGFSVIEFITQFPIKVFAFLTEKQNLKYLLMVAGFPFFVPFIFASIKLYFICFKKTLIYFDMLEKIRSFRKKEKE